MSLHNIIGSEAYIHEGGRDVWAGMLRFVRSRRSFRIRKFIRWPAAVGIGAFVGLSALGIGSPLVVAGLVGLGAGLAVAASDGWSR